MRSIPLDEKPETTFADYFFGFPNTVTEIPIKNCKVIGNNIEYTKYSEDTSVNMTKQINLAAFSEYKNLKEVETDFIKTQTFRLGTDKYVRDLLSRMLIGSCVSLSIGFVAVFISLIVGIFFGAIGGYFDGKTDAFCDVAC